MKVTMMSQVLMLRSRPQYLTRLPKGLEDRRTSLGEPSRPTLTHFSLLACFIYASQQNTTHCPGASQYMFSFQLDTQCKCAAFIHRCNTTRIKKSNMGASMQASYCWNYFLLSRFPCCVGQSTTFYWALNRTLNCHLIIQKDASLPSTLLLV